MFFSVFTRTLLWVLAIQLHVTLDRCEGLPATVDRDASVEYEASPWWLDLKSPKMPLRGIFKCGDHELSRLPTGIQPTHYELGFEVTNKTNNYVGGVRIDIEVTALEPQDHIVIHAGQYLTIKSIWYDSSDIALGSIEIAEVCREGEMLKVSLAENLRTGDQGRLFIVFDNKRDHRVDYKKGLYETPRTFWGYVRYGRTYDLVTKLEAVDARTLFPCFDEPSFKATFSLTLVHPSNLTPLSNTKPIRQDPQPNDNLMTVFETTPKMSSYLLAFSLGEYEYIERKINDDSLTVRVYDNKGMVSLSEEGLDMTCSAIQKMENYTDIPYPLDKFDVLLVTKHPSAAMENFGLVTMKEEYVRYTSEQAEAVAQVASVTTYVSMVVHQWFGNMVTAKWWTEIWLNEGLSKFFKKKLVEELRPDLDFEHFYLLYDIQLALHADMKPDVGAIQSVSVEGRSEIEEMFNRITYYKAGHVMAMVEDMIGPELMQTAMRNYLSKFMYASAEPEDLMKVFDQLQTEHPVRAFLKSWIEQPHFPLVQVAMDSEGIVNFRQECFSCRKDTNQLWMVPLTVVFGHEASGRVATLSTMMTEAEMEMNPPMWFNMSDPSSWLKVNKDYKGYYVVEYSQDLLHRLRVGLRQKNALTPADKINLLFDARLMVEAKRSTPLDLARLLVWILKDNNQQHGAVWHELVSVVNVIEESAPESKEHLRRFVRNHFSPVFDQFGFKSTSDIGGPSVSDNIGHENVLTALILAHHEPTIREALRVFDEADSRAYPTGLITPIILAVVQNGSEEQVDRLFDRFAIYSSNFEKSHIQYVMMNAGFNKDNYEITFERLEELDYYDDTHLDIFKKWAESDDGREFLIKTFQEESDDYDNLEKYLRYSPDNLAELVYVLVDKQNTTVDELFPSHSRLEFFKEYVPQIPVERALQSNYSPFSKDKLREILDDKESLDVDDGVQQDMSLE